MESAWGLGGTPYADGNDMGASAEDLAIAGEGRAESEELCQMPAGNGAGAGAGGGGAKSAAHADPDNSDDETAQVRPCQRLTGCHTFASSRWVHVGG